MERTTIFTSVKSAINNKKLKQDDNGYYHVNLGGLNVFNSSGSFYTSEGVKETLENTTSSLSRRSKGRYLKGEIGHPKYERGMSKSDYYNK